MNQDDMVFLLQEHRKQGKQPEPQGGIETESLSKLQGWDEVCL